jgi:hypothetical protein
MASARRMRIVFFNTICLLGNMNPIVDPVYGKTVSTLCGNDFIPPSLRSAKEICAILIMSFSLVSLNSA